jgi:formylmethanofuran dehydrogenase subunit C
MPLVLDYRGNTGVPVEVEGLLPAALADLSRSEIERREIVHGNRELPLAELFAVSGSAADGELVFRGDLAGVHWIGAKLAAGVVRVEGDAGRHVGSEMSGGEIHVSGSAGDCLGGEMKGGLIHVRGRAGDLVGAAYRGSRHGMTGGTILVHGLVGDEAGHTMRRGLLATGGCGDFVALNMIAGTILVFGPCGARPAAGMRRGTLGLFGPQPPQLLPTFRSGSRDRPLFLQLLFRELERLGYPLDAPLTQAEYHTWHGDLVTVGRGEVLLPAG